MKALIRLLSLALLFLSPPAICADAKALPGVWLIEPLYFDVLVEQGLVTPEFPVLVIRPDGAFRLYRVGVFCEVLDQYERLSQEPGVLARACARASQRSRPDLGSAFGVISAAGKWKASQDGSLQFLVEERGHIPKYYEDTLKELRETLEKTRRNIEPLARDPRSRQFMEERSRRELAKGENFYTTLYVLDGKQLRFAVDEQLLQLEGPHPDDLLIYRRTDPEVLEAATGSAILFEVSATKYFRCLVDYFQRAPLTDERQEVIKAARGASALYAGKPSIDLALLRPVERPLDFHPAKRAMKERKLGAYLGCPSRDLP
jgi:hypothetical protein